MRRLERVEVVNPIPKTADAVPDRLVVPSPTSDDHEVRAVAQHRPGFEKREEVLPGLDGADEQDEALRQLESLASRGQLLAAHRPKSRRNAMGHHGDA